MCTCCLSNLHSPKCPHCRKPIDGETTLVEMTATEQWDKLLKVAKKWALMDVYHEDDIIIFARDGEEGEMGRDGEDNEREDEDGGER